jgi:hypothetical protein
MSPSTHTQLDGGEFAGAPPKSSSISKKNYGSADPLRCACSISSGGVFLASAANKQPLGPLPALGAGCVPSARPAHPLHANLLNHRHP